MARQLWLLRHAEAEPHGTRSDAQRMLTARGERQARAAGAAIALLTFPFETVLVSPKARAKETAEIAAAACPAVMGDAIVEHPPLAGGYGAQQALADIASISADGRLMLVGHEPDLASVIGDLTGAAIALKKGGLALVRLRGAAGELALLLRPLELALIAGEGGLDV